MADIYAKTRSSILPDHITDEYQIFHDCGKPFCLEIGEDGKRRYPGHAEKSAEIWMALEDRGNNAETIADLMRHDMDFHTMRGEEISELWNCYLAPTLYFTAWAELYANAQMFGGFDSDSFKIKRKRLIKAGNYV